MLLRAKQIGFSVEDLEHINMGLLYDCFIEMDYDEHGYIREATQADFDAF